jgi:phage terminase large subunit-like protein
MRSLTGIILLITIYFIAGCSKPQDATVSVNPTVTYNAFEDASKKPDASITHDGDWTVVSRMEKGDRVYWFVAPDVNKVSPALFKKTIHVDDKDGKKIVIVSNCEAPKQTCDDLMEKFKTLSEKYN